MVLDSRRLALGTAQFGMPYGVANRTGQVSRAEVARLLSNAWAAGIDTLDTAIAYGESEQVLGEIGVGRWRVISKLPALPNACVDIGGWVQESICGSLERLGIPKLLGVLLHRPQQLHGRQGEALYGALRSLKDQRLVEKIGVSIYAPDELDATWPHFHPDLVQAPFNVLDHRLASSGWLTRLHQAGTEVHTRSIFLQGLLLMDGAKLPAAFARWLPLWKQWQSWLAEQALTPLQGCLGFVLSQPEIDRVVVGIDSLEQLQGILASVDSARLTPPGTLMSEDQDLINPSRWNAS